MEDLAADFIINNNPPIEFDAEISPSEHFDCSFEIFASGTTWGNISGTLSDQTDLQNALDLKADKSEVESVTGALADSITAVSDNLQSEATTRADNDTILQNNINTVSNNLTVEIGNRTSADTILQSNINAIDNKYISITGGLSDRIDTLSDTVTANYNALDDKIDSINGALSDSINAVDDKYNSITGGLSDDIDALESVVSANYNTLSDSISDEATARQNADSIIGDSITALDNKFDSITGGLSDSIIAIDNTINNYGDIVTYNAADFATSAQGALADTALQPNDNISELTNNAGYITSSALDGYATESFVTSQGYITDINGTDVVNALGYTPYDASNPDGYTTNVGTVTSVNNTSPDANGNVTITIPDTAAWGNITGTLSNQTDLQQALNRKQEQLTQPQLDAVNSGANSTNIGQIATNTQDISDEITNRQNADNDLQSQIDALVVSSDVFDVVGTYADLQAYDISTVPVNDIIKVLVDSTHNDAATYYRCVENGGVKSWSYIGSEGAYYTKGEADSKFALQTTTVNGQALSSNVNLTASDVGALPDTTVIPTVNDSTITFQVNSTNIDTITLNQSSNDTINISVPTDTNDLTNGAGYITGINSTDVINALGYTPYSDANPDGYISGITSGDVTTALGYTPYDASNPNGYITNSDLTNYVTTNTAQTISAKKTFTGEKAILFKQTSNSDKLGFTLYNSSNTELGAFEYRPNTISGAALLNVNTSYANSCYVGFRYWGTAVNVIAPKPSTAGDYYIPINFTDGNTTVTANNAGLVNISSLLPTVPTNISAFTNDSGYITSSALSGYATETWVGQQGYITGITSSDVTTALGYTPQEELTSGTNIKTINNTSILGSGNIDTSEIFIAEYGTTTYLMISQSISSNKTVFCKYNNRICTYFQQLSNAHTFVYCNGNSQLAKITIDNSNAWNIEYTNLANTSLSNLSTTGQAIIDGKADTTLSNVSSIDSNSAVQTALDGKVSKSGDTMTGGLVIQRDDNGLFLHCQRTDAIKGTTPSSSKYWGLHFIDGQGSDVANRMGGVELRYTDAGGVRTDLLAYEPTSGSTTNEKISIGYSPTGGFWTLAPKPIASSDTTNIATTNWVNDNLYYRAGDTVTSLSDYIVAGYLTSSKTRLRFAIPLPKRMNKINTVTINTLVINARQGEAGYLPSATWNAKTGSTVSASFTNNMLHIECYSTTAFTSFTNNVIVNVAFDSFKCTFT